ncbi:hypothetical protein [Paenibacillus sp. y28]|uniref:hypothetical protein n=1 Tax=Paenibacillus sp. y28 TaxID=3129110 RepID=UPI00301A3B1A
MLTRPVQRWRLLALACALIVIAAGCKDNKAAKAHLQEAYIKQAEMKTYRFEGEAALTMPLQATGNINPVYAAVLSTFRDSRLEWSGISSSDPVRFEGTVKITPKDSPAAVEIPVILKDSKLALSIPLLNKPGEYTVADLTALGDKQGAPSVIQPEHLKASGELMRTIMNTLIDSLDPAWFTEQPQQFTVHVDEKNLDQASAALTPQLPLLVDALKQYSLLGAETADKLKKQAASSKLALKAPTDIQVHVDENGFIRDQTASLVFDFTNDSGKAYAYQLKLTQRYSDINSSSITFEKEIPASSKPLEQILRLLSK